MLHDIQTSYAFDKIAAAYDRWYDCPLGGMYDKLEKRAFDIFVKNDSQRKTVLEIGCGTGHWSRYFSDKGFDVTGVDISEEMIKIANLKNISNCRFLIADGTSLPFMDNSFDAAAAITSIEFSERPEKIVSEMSRCVKPGGRLFFGVLNRLCRYNQKKAGLTESIYSYADFLSPGDLKKMLEPFGSVRILTTGFVLKVGCLMWLSPLWDCILRSLGSSKGSFIVAEVQNKNTNT